METSKSPQQSVKPDVEKKIDLEIEDLEPKAAPAIIHNHNETFVQ